jgi:tRNA threonylcarbamoyladenosine biosynthesis protein TsaE
MQIRVEELNDLAAATQTFLELTKGRKHFAFYAKVGAGKTTFITSLLNLMGIEDHVSTLT